MPKNNYVCVRHHRIKTLGEGSASLSGEGFGAMGRWRHALRLQKTPNSNPDLVDFNRVATLETGWKFETFGSARQTNQKLLQADFLSKLAAEKIHGFHIKSLRCDATYIEELHLSISPEFLRDGNESNKLNQPKVELQNKAAMKFLQARFGDNLLAVVVHNDEANPHLCAFVLPALRKLKNKRGRPSKLQSLENQNPKDGWTLSARDMFSPIECSRDQDRFAAACQAEGLAVRRGIEGSRTPHQIMRSHLALVHTEKPVIRPIQLLLPTDGFEGLKQSKQNYYQAAQADLNDQIQSANQTLHIFDAKARERDREVTQRKAYQETAAEKSIQLIKTQEELAQVKAELDLTRDENKKLAVRVRDISLPEVAQSLGLQPDESTNIFRSTLGKIKLHEKGFINEATGEKGRNAIDLAQHVLGCDFGTTVRWLSDHFKSEQTLDAARFCAAQRVESIFEQAQKKGQFTLQESLEICAQPAPEKWPDVKRKLQEHSAFPSEKLDSWHEAKLIQASSTGQLICALRPSTLPENQLPTGYAILQPSSPFMIAQRIGNPEAVFAIYEKNQENDCEVAITNSAIEAMAYSALHPKTNVFGLSGNQSLESIVLPFVQSQRRLCLAFPTDFALDQLHEKAMEVLRSFGKSAADIFGMLVRCLTPLNGTWVNDLKAFRTPENYQKSIEENSRSGEARILGK